MKIRFWHFLAAIYGHSTSLINNQCHFCDQCNFFEYNRGFNLNVFIKFRYIMKNLLWEIYIPNNMMYPALFQKLSHPGINQGVTRLGLGKCWEIVVVSNRIPVNVDADFVLVHFTKILIIDRLMCVSCHLNRASNDKSRVKFWMFVLTFFQLTQEN